MGMQFVSGQELDIMSVNKAAFIPVIRKNDVIKVTPLTRKQKASIKPGSPDVVAEPFVGRKGLISRIDVKEYFRYTSGHKINMLGWKEGKSYIIYRNDDTPAFALKVPNGVSIRVSQSCAQPGQYVVCLPDQSNMPDYSTASVLSNKLFHKMFIIIKSEQLTNIIYRKKTPSNRGVSRINSRENTDMTRNPAQMQSNPTQTISVPRNNRPMQQSHNPINPVNSNSGPVKFKLTGQIHNNIGRRVGYEVMSSKGTRRDCDITTVMKMCQQKLVINAELVNRDGKFFLRGNNMSLDELPIKYQ